MLSSYVVTDYDFEWVILSILNLRLFCFNRCSLIQLRKEMNRLSRKEINWLLSKGMSNIYLKVAVEKN